MICSYEYNQDTDLDIEEIKEELNYCIEKKNLEVYSWVIMSNHIHMVAKVREPYEMSGFLRDFKKYTSKAFIKRMYEINESRKD